MRIERRPGPHGRVYILAVEQNGGRKRVVASFGNEADPRTKRRLRGFLHALEGSTEYPTTIPPELNP